MRYVYEYYKNGIELKKSQVSKLITEATDKHPLFKPLAKQMDLHRMSDREDLLQRLYDIYNCGANAGFSGLIGWLKQEANEIGCSSTLAFLGDYLGADLDDYKWRAVQALANYLAIDIMESEI